MVPMLIDIIYMIMHCCDSNSHPSKCRSLDYFPLLRKGKTTDIYQILHAMSILSSIRGVFDLKSDPPVCERNSQNDSEGVGLSKKVRPDLDSAGSNTPK